ncbi:Hypothetical_protein [Hexamita inflata]|uniref:Hypothetical_protein n=1 Tax=Hexamita inflata TaxID=28002 RepID=A0AA86PXR2_9EUKA|nr:Hypothetical protein HINF_LOCUS35839 [Hexamita inflata]
MSVQVNEVNEMILVQSKYYSICLFMLSGLLFNSQQIIELLNTSIQYRFSSLYSAGIVMNMSSIGSFSLNNVNILGSNQLKQYSYVLVAIINTQITASISNVIVCYDFNDIQQKLLQFSTSLIHNCISICQITNTKYTYGLCTDELINSQHLEINDSYTCVDPFIFNGSQCVCKEGYILNISYCIDLASQLTNTISLVSKLDYQFVIIQQDILSTLDSLNIMNQNLNEQINQSKLTSEQLFNKSQQFIFGNTTQLQQQLQIYSSVLDQSIFNNVTLINIAIAANSTNLQNMINSSVLQINTTISTINSSINLKNNEIANNFSSINYTLTQQNYTINSLLSTVSDLQNKLVDQENAELEPELEINDFQLPELICNQMAFIQKFDISTISQTVSSSNFSSSYVFGNTQIVNNVFINILDNSLTNSFSLYNHQTYYYNIKVQIGSQSIQSGSIISDQNIKSMNNIIILSKIGSLSAISMQLNILSRESTGLCIRNLYVSMLISNLSNGNISLIGLQNSVLNIRNYQVTGAYYSKQCMSLCVLNSNQAQISITNVNFKPNTYMFGNQSSYLFVQISTSSILIKQLVLSVGLQIARSIQTTLTSTSSNQLQYGGVISQISTSSVIIHDTAVQTYLKQTANFVNSSGIIIGTSISSIISINQLCAFENTTFAGSALNQYGLFGTIGGKISFMDVNINYSAFGNGQFSNFGTMGLLTIDCNYGTFTNIQITFVSIQKSSYEDNEINIAALIGNCNAKQVLFKHSIIYGNISAASNVALICGQQNSNFTIHNIELANSIILSSTQIQCSISGGLFGFIQSVFINTYYGLKISVQVQSIALNYNSYSSCVIGYVNNKMNLTIEKCYVHDSTIQSKSQNKSFASGVLSYAYMTKFIGTDIQFDNQSVVSQNNFSYSSGLIAYSENCNITISKIFVTYSQIVSNANLPHSGGYICIAVNSLLNIYKSQINKSQIKGIDNIQNINFDNTLIGQTGGIIAMTNHSNISIISTDIQNSNLSQICKLFASLGGIQGEQYYTQSRIRNIKITNIILTGNSSILNSHISGVNGAQLYSDAFQENIQLLYINIQSNSIGQSLNGGLNAYCVESNINIINIQLIFANQIINGIDSYGGGLLGAVVKSKLYIINSQIQYTNISSNTNQSGIIGAAIGSLVECDITVFDNLQIHNVRIVMISGNSLTSGSFIGMQYSSNSQQPTQTYIRNSIIDSIYINTQSTRQQINLITQYPNVQYGTIQITSTKSIGISNINGAPIINCENVQVQLINGNNFISENGCI